jgi:hypothetical protein
MPAAVPILRPVMIRGAARRMRTTISRHRGLFMCAHPKGVRAINEPLPDAGA